MKTTTTFCDICKSKEEKGVQMHREKLQVIFVTEQTEGYPCKPYLTTEHLDICAQCLARVLDGSAIFASGAQGQNTYTLRRK